MKFLKGLFCHEELVKIKTLTFAMEKQRECFINFIRLTGINPFLLGIDELKSPTGDYTIRFTQEEINFMTRDLDVRKNPVDRSIFNILSGNYSVKD